MYFVVFLKPQASGLLFIVTFFIMHFTKPITV